MMGSFERLQQLLAGAGLERDAEPAGLCESASEGIRDYRMFIGQAE
jgi:hypothetical protein